MIWLFSLTLVIIHKWKRLFVLLCWVAIVGKQNNILKHVKRNSCWLGPRGASPHVL